MKKTLFVLSGYSLALIMSLSFFFTIFYLLEVNTVIGIAVSVFVMLSSLLLITDKNFIQDIEE